MHDMCDTYNYLSKETLSLDRGLGLCRVSDKSKSASVRVTCPKESEVKVFVKFHFAFSLGKERLTKR